MTGSKGVNQNDPNMVWNKLRQVLEWSSEEFIWNFSSVDDKQYMQCGLASIPFAISKPSPNNIPAKTQFIAQT